MILYILIFLGMFITPLYSNSIKLQGGMENKLDYTDFYEHPYISKSDLKYAGFLYLGFSSTSYVGFDQFFITITPGLLLYNKNDIINENQIEPTFFFRDAYIRWDGIFSIIVGKRALGWGFGNIRQYSFFVNEEFAEETSRYYNVEIQKRTGPILFSMGFATDTASIDKLEKPTWYAPWAYVRIDNSKYTIIGTLNMFWKEKIGYDAKGSLEFQYFLPKDFQIYSTFAYNILLQDKIGNVNEIRSLIGLQYDYMYDENFIFIPIIEYAWENYNNLLSIGFNTSINKAWTILLFYNYEYHTQTEDTISSILSRISWTPNQHLSLQLTYTHDFEESSVTKNKLTMRLLWKI